ncbi:MAG: 50S ribosomal protein L15 [Candidatus Omnitrophota bacterium]
MVLRLENIGKPKKLRGNSKRKGRGIGSGRGKTSGRGHKGAKARAGGRSFGGGFEGGQMPLIRRVPKRGFTNKFKKEWNIINVGDLDRIERVEDGAIIDKDFLLANKILKKKSLPLKVLGKGKLGKAITVKADAVSAAAKTIIEEAGGKIELI